MLLNMSKRKVVKTVAQVATFAVITAYMTAAYKEYIPVEYANKLAVRVGKAILYYTVANTAVNFVGQTLDDAFNENQQ